MASTVSSSFPLQEIYQQKEYGKNKKNIPHFLIAWNRDPKTVCDYLDRHPNCLEARDHNGLTPFAVACLAGHARMADELLKRGATALPLDCHRWTPLHYTFVNNDKALAAVVENAARAQKAVLPSLDAMRQTLIPPLPSRHDCRVGLMQTKKGGFVPLTQAQFSEMSGGARIKHTPFATRQSLVDFWMRGPIPAERHPSEKQYIDVLSQEYGKYRASASECLALRPLGRGSFQVIAANDLSAFTVVGVHGGKISPRSPAEENDEHRFDELDASEVRNCVSMVRDGIPNCTVQTHFEDGLFHYLFIPVRPIKKGEELFVDFGPSHSIKFAHRKFSEEALRYYTDNPPMRLWNRLRSLDTAKKSHLFPIEGIRTQIRYFFSTPYLFLQLLTENRIDRAEIRSLLRDPAARQVLELSESTVATYTAILDAWDALEAHFKRIPPSLKAQILENLSKFIQTQPIHLVTQMFFELPAFLPEAVDQAGWERVFVILNENGIGQEILYDWMKGEASDREALQAYLAIHPRSRVGFHLSLMGIADRQFPEKHKPLRMLRARSAVHNWLRASSLDGETVLALKDLEFDELEELSRLMLPHLQHKHPRKVHYFNTLIRTLLSIPQSEESK